MPAKSRKILFIGHDASRSGAPISLLRIMRWLKSELNWEMAVLLAGRGAMFEEYQALAPVHVLDQQNREPMRLPFSPDVAFYNTVASVALIPPSAKRVWPRVCHVREMESAIRGFLPPSSELFRRLDRFIVSAEAVGQNLIDNHGVQKDRIDVVGHTVPVAQIESQAEKIAASPSLKKTRNLSDDALIVGCGGNPHWCKGSDLFIRVAMQVIKQASQLPIYFVWVGGSDSSIPGFQFDYDLARLPDLKGRIVHLPSQLDPLPSFAGFDIFLMPSREDAMPLVCLESAVLGKPIVCFAQAGGMPEFVREDAGVVVPYLDVDAMSAAVIRLLGDPQLRQKMGEVGQQRVREEHNISITGPRIVQSIESVLM